MWLINDDFEVVQSYYREGNKEKLNVEKLLEQGRYFASEEDAQAWLDAMKNNRR